MTPTMTPQLSRITAILLLLSLAGLVFLMVVHPVIAKYRSAQETIESLRSRLAHYERIAGRRGTLNEEIRRLKNTQRTDRYFLKNRAEALAVAELQSRISKVVAASGGTLLSTQPLNMITTELLPRVRLRVRMTGDINAIQKMLHQLESGTPVLLIDDMAINSQTGFARRATEKDAAPILNVQFDLSGYMRATS